MCRIAEAMVSFCPCCLASALYSAAIDVNVHEYVSQERVLSLSRPSELFSQFRKFRLSALILLSNVASTSTLSHHHLRILYVGLNICVCGVLKGRTIRVKEVKALSGRKKLLESPHLRYSFMGHADHAM